MTANRALELPHYETPKNDNQRLLNYQYTILTGDASAYNAMYKLGRKIALKLICTAARKNEHVAALPQEVKLEKAHNAITYIMEQYLTREDFAIKKSFTGYIWLRVAHELFYKRKVDGVVDYVDEETLKDYGLEMDK